MISDKVNFYKHKSFIISSFLELEDKSLSEVVKKIESISKKAKKKSSLENKEKENREKLSGRGNVLKLELSPFGPVVLKQYLRGGVYSNINPDKYLSLDVKISKLKYRSEEELKMLKFLLDIGLNVPKPILAVRTKGVFYKNWLLMEDLGEEKSLVGLSAENKELVSKHMPLLCQMVAKLIENRICHVDLHPGNVILSKSGKLYMIDFDKAYIFKGCKNKLRDYYLCRWRRAVIKHGLSSELSEYFCMGLRTNFNKSNELNY